MSDELGVAMTRCYFCNEPHEIVINRLLTSSSAKKVKELDGKVIDMQPCPKCEEFMRMGIILISISERLSEKYWNVPKGKGWIPNPYRTGGWWVVTEDAVQRVFAGNDDVLNFALRNRYMFITDEAAEAIGLGK